MQREMIDGLGLLGVGLTVISLRGEIKQGNIFPFLVMVVCGFFILGISLSMFVKGFWKKYKTQKKSKKK